MELRGKIALVTGAARGIGRAIAIALAREGCDVGVADVGGVADPVVGYRLGTGAELEATAAAVRSCGVRGEPVTADVTRAADVEAMVARIVELFGGIDILVNNAGVIGACPVAAMPEELWDRVIAVNLKGTFLCSRAVIPQLVARGGGRIVNISSVVGRRGRGGVAAYSASKFGVIGFTQSLAEELGPAGITVNAVCPGYLRTAMWSEVLDRALAPLWGVSEREVFAQFVERATYLKREQRPEDIGEAVVYLCRAENVTGISLIVAGGGEVS